MITAPIKRHKSLRPLSREHHDSLLLCWKIRRGLQKSVEPSRILEYVRYCAVRNLLPHFEVEEQVVFPVLGTKNEMVRDALEQHARLRALFDRTAADAGMLLVLEQLLEKHIRFEERVLFQEIQKAATPEQMLAIEESHAAIAPEEEWADKFWEG